MPSRSLLSSLLIAVLFAGCFDYSNGTSGGGGGGGGGNGGEAGDGGNTGDGGSGDGGTVVTGIDASIPLVDGGIGGGAFLYYVSDQGTTAIAQDVSGVTFGAFNFDFSLRAGTFVQGAGTAGGTFSIPSVPTLPTNVRYGSSYVQTSARQLDLSDYVLGRPDSAPFTQATNLTFNLQNAAPWDPMDVIELTSANAGVVDLSLATGFLDGGTGLNFVVDAMDHGWNQIKGSRGDQVYVAQLTARPAATSSSVPYVALAKSWQSNSVELEDGQSQVILSPMQSSAESTVSFSWPRSSFESTRTGVNPAAQPYGQSLYLSVLPYGSAGGRGQFSALPDLLISEPTPSTSDVAFTGSFANPYPATWTPIASVAHIFRLQLSTALGTVTLYPFIESTKPLADVSQGTLGVVVSPVSGATVDSTSLWTPHQISSTPALQWVPGQGSPDLFRLDVLKVIANTSGGATTSTVARYYTTSSAVILNGALASGQYIFRIVAIKAATDPLHPWPFTRLPYASADAVSAVMTVP